MKEETKDYHCPTCKVSLRGDRIPDDMSEHYSDTHWGREIGIEDSSIYDGISWWLCPDCGHVWKRFSWAPEYTGDVSELLKSIKERE
jgi:ribosomal protein L37AE/L43A